MKRLLIVIAAALSFACTRQEVIFLNNMTAECTLKKGEVIMLPVQEDAPAAKLYVIGNKEKIQYDILPATSTVDYHVQYKAEDNCVVRIEGVSFQSVFYKKLKRGHDGKKHSFLHFTPSSGWINDPNGLVYKDGVWHMYFQYNPFFSKWGNMSWGHATSKDLVNWKEHPVALMPDSLGMIFSGSAACDKNRIAAMYTSAGKGQSQSLAWSYDGGMTYVKLPSNPVLKSSNPDFRDPKIFRYEDSWRMVLASGNTIEIYSSSNLIDWDYESCFGEEIGNHGGVWECPDLFELPYLDGKKWVLLVSNTRDTNHGSAVQYFIGDFDGSEFTPCDNNVRWLDYGRDFYAAASWNDAPDGRRVAIAWANNWQYANDIPFVGTRGGMTVPRELSLLDYGDDIVLKNKPVHEIVHTLPHVAGRNPFIWEGKVVDGDEIVLRNKCGEALKISFSRNVVSVNRRFSGNVTFNDAYPSIDRAPIQASETHDVSLLVDSNLVEIFIDDGAVSFTESVFPSRQYSIIDIW
ncbi:MAG: GH32 C-terminal domain-containing protein [Bacteroidales bacterium]|nr:GH32 C-terminal domain-containing protein [Bacteroidales bacterium]